MTIEFAKIGEEYRKADEIIREHYDNYIGIVIENNVKLEFRENLYFYWEGLKRKVEK